MADLHNGLSLPIIPMMTSAGSSAPPRLTVSAGEIVTVLGPNGRGTSTLLRAVASLHAGLLPVAMSAPISTPR